jgi:hypothetical protein
MPKGKVAGIGVYTGPRTFVVDDVRVLPWRAFLAELWGEEIVGRRRQGCSSASKLAISFAVPAPSSSSKGRNDSFQPTTPRRERASSLPSSPT